jgi:hypothetical protein
MLAGPVDVDELDRWMRKGWSVAAERQCRTRTAKTSPPVRNQARMARSPYAYRTRTLASVLRCTKEVGLLALPRGPLRGSA